MFSNVTVREYEIRPSDNPAVTSGAAIEVCNLIASNDMQYIHTLGVGLHM